MAGRPLSESVPGADDSCDVFHLDRQKVAALRVALLDAKSVAALAETFRLLGDMTRVRILDALSRAELCVCDIARLLGSSESAVSHQLRLLRSLRLVRPRRAGRMVYYRLDDQHIVRLFAQGLEHVQESLRVRASPDPVETASGSLPATVRDVGRPEHGD